MKLFNYKKFLKISEFVLALFFMGLAILFNFIGVAYSDNLFRNDLLTKTVPLIFGSASILFLLLFININFFSRFENLFYLLPCLIIALNNMQWHALFTNKIHLISSNALDFFLFALHCLFVGFFEELLYRGLLFSFLAFILPRNKKGFSLAFIFSSLSFGIAHLLNGFSPASVLQAGYSILTGGLFAFCLIKTKNIFCCALIHSVFNFCGLLFDSQFLGSGIVFDLGTILTMIIIDVLIGIYIVYKIFTFSDAERNKLYSLISKA